MYEQVYRQGRSRPVAWVVAKALTPAGRAGRSPQRAAAGAELWREGGREGEKEGDAGGTPPVTRSPAGAGVLLCPGSARLAAVVAGTRLLEADELAALAPVACRAQPLQRAALYLFCFSECHSLIFFFLNRKPLCGSDI